MARERKVRKKLKELKEKAREKKSARKMLYDDKSIDSITNEDILSHVGQAAYETLRSKHARHQTVMWNITQSKMISLHHTPDVFTMKDEDLLKTSNHSNWFPERMCEIISRTTQFCDIMSLGAPDGYFLEQFQQALRNLCDTSLKETIIIRLLFGNIIGMPINCKRLVRTLTDDLLNNKIQLWVGAWRHGQSWNHSKLIAVDGKYLHTGGHNLWTDVYLQQEPVHDLSIELEGLVAQDAHKFANTHWKFIEKKLDSKIGQIRDDIPDFLPVGGKNRVIISDYKGSTKFPPSYKLTSSYVPEGAVPVLSIGRLGQLVDDDRPSDDAFIAMIDSSEYIVKMCLQDIGPACIPGQQIPLPGTGWPINYLDAIARAIWERNVEFEIVLSTLECRFGYNNGWATYDVAAEIGKRIILNHKASDQELRRLVEQNLRLCYMCHPSGNEYPGDGGFIANHTKFFIVDDVCSYTGSQNIYVCDLAEWGVVIDDVDVTSRIIDEYWDPLWDASFHPDDNYINQVMDGLDVDRTGDIADFKRGESRKALREGFKTFARMQFPNNKEAYDEEDDDEDDDSNLN